MLFLAAWLHKLDPFLVRFPEGWPIDGLRWYGLSYIAGFVLAWALVRRVTRAGVSPLPTVRVPDFVMAVAIGIIVGGRLGYVLFYDPSLFGMVDGPPYWGVLAINRGGMASHGGMIGGLVGCFVFARRNKLPALHLFDLMAFAAPLGLCMGRIANFIKGELYGRPCDERFAFAVRFPEELWSLPREQLAALYAAHAEMPASADGELAMRVDYEAVYAWAADLIERVQGFAGPEAQRQAAALIEPHLVPRHPSQLYAAALEGIVTFAVLLAVYRGPVKPGVIAGWFGMTYAVMRVVNEFFRMPDEGIALQFGLTRGQWLSVGLFVAGLALWAWARRRRVEPLGGWLKQT